MINAVTGDRSVKVVKILYRKKYYIFLVIFYMFKNN